MAKLEPSWPDAEQVGLEILDATGVPTVTATDEDLDPPLIRVKRLGGSDDGITDRPRLEVECFAATRQQAWDLAELCRQLLLAASGATTPSGVLVDKVISETPIQQIPYANDDLRRVQATYRVDLRRQYHLLGSS